MIQTKAAVLAHIPAAPDHFLMRLKAPRVAREALPGQFIHVRCGEGTFPLLRRPFSLSDADPRQGTIEFIYKVVGAGSSRLTQVTKGEKVDLIGPLGHPFEIPSSLKIAYLIGGGVGIPPLVFLAKELTNRKKEVAVFCGARTQKWIICQDQFRQLKVPSFLATDDGTNGYHGSVVDLVKKRIAGEKKNGVVLYMCGPLGMMAAAADCARSLDLTAYVSLEERMGCAMGCCLGCVVEIATEPTKSYSRFQRVCTEGPVFPAEKIVWQ